MSVREAMPLTPAGSGDDTWATRGAARWIVAGLPLAFGLVFYVLNATQRFTAVPGHVGDARFNSVVLEHFYRLLTGQDKDIWTLPLFYPFKGTLAFSDNLFGTAPVYALFRFLGVSRAIAVDLWFTIGFIVNYAVTYHVTRRFGFSPIAAAFAAFAFTFALPMLEQETHMQLVYRFACPLAFFALWEAFQQRRLIVLASAVFWLVVQFYCAFYLGIFLGIVLLFAGLGLLVSEWRGLGQMLRSPAAEKPVALVLRLVLALASLAALAWLMWPYLYYSHLYNLHRDWGGIMPFLPELWSYLMTDREPYVAPVLSLLVDHMRNEHQLFLGLPLLALLVMGAVRAVLTRSTLGLVALLIIVLGFVLTIAIGDNSLYWYVWKLPGISALGAPGRLILVVLLPISLLAAIAIEWLWGIARAADPARGIAIVVLVLAGGGTLAELGFYRPDWRSIAAWDGREAAIMSQLPAKLPADAILLLTSPPGVEFYWPTDVTAMVVAQDLGIVTLNGYSGNFPPGYTDSRRGVTPAAMLSGYFKFAQTTPAEQQALLARVIVIEAPPDGGWPPGER
jgi:hypothetical protein